MKVKWISVDEELPVIDSFVWFIYHHEYREEPKEFLCFGKFMPSSFGERFVGTELLYPGNTTCFYHSDNCVLRWAYANVPDIDVEIN